MSIRLDNGSSFRVLCTKGKDITCENKAQAKRLELDVDGDGSFTGPKDRALESPDQLNLLCDSVKGNIGAITFPFAEEIDTHLSQVKCVNGLLDQAKKYGLEAKKASFWQVDKKMQAGKKALLSAQASYQMDSANPKARFAYGVILASIQDSLFKGTAEEHMEIDIDSEVERVIQKLESDRGDLMGQILLKHLYETSENSEQYDLQKTYLRSVKKTNPTAYRNAKKAYQEAIN